MPSIIYDYTPEDLQNLLDTSNGYADVLRKIGINPKGGNPETLKKVIAEYSLDTTKLNENRKKLYSDWGNSTSKKNVIPLEDILMGKVKNYHSCRLLKRLVDAGYKKYQCETCGITEWNGKQITLQLHHENGDHEDNSLDNLKILCPNCHSQTETYAGKSTRKKKESFEVKPTPVESEKEKRNPKIPRDELKSKIRSNSFNSIGKEYGVSDNAIRKWCDKYNLPRHKREIEKITDEEWLTI